MKLFNDKFISSYTEKFSYIYQREENFYNFIQEQHCYVFSHFI